MPCSDYTLHAIATITLSAHNTAPTPGRRMVIAQEFRHRRVEVLQRDRPAMPDTATAVVVAITFDGFFAIASLTVIDVRATMPQQSATTAQAVIRSCSQAYR